MLLSRLLRPFISSELLSGAKALTSSPDAFWFINLTKRRRFGPIYWPFACRILRSRIKWLDLKSSGICTCNLSSPLLKCSSWQISDSQWMRSVGNEEHGTICKSLDHFKCSLEFLSFHTTRACAFLPSVLVTSVYTSANSGPLTKETKFLYLYLWGSMRILLAAALTSLNILLKRLCLT